MSEKFQNQHLTETTSTPIRYEVLHPTAYHTSAETPAELHERYTSRTSHLIEKIVGKNTDEEPGFDTVIFLDKSARPLAWMTRKLWPHLAPQNADPDSGELETVKMPDMKFVNIDRIHWRTNPSKPIDKQEDMRQPTADEIQGLRNIFHITSPSGKTTNKSLVGKRVLIVDEQKETGDTLKVAAKLFEQAFPDAKLIDTYAWIEPETEYNPKTGERVPVVKEIPVWYPQKNQANALFPTDGRGIYDPAPNGTKITRQNKRLTKESYRFLGTPARRVKHDSELSDTELAQIDELETSLSKKTSEEQKAAIRGKIESIQTEEDPKSIKLRKEIGQMAIDFANGKFMPRIPSDRLALQGMTKEEYYKKRAQYLKKPKSIRYR